VRNTKQLSEIPIRQLPLHVCPKRPEQSYKIDASQANLYTDLLPKEQKDVARKAIASTQHISMSKFDKHLKECVHQLNAKLKNGEKPFSLGLSYAKSNQWVASLAIKDLDYLPTSHFSLGDKQGTTNVKKLAVPYNGHSIEQDRVVLFDDCSYSGIQLADNVRRVATTLASRESPQEIFVVVPFMTQAAQEHITRLGEKYDNVSITLITSHKTIKTIVEIFNDPDELQKFDCLTHGQALATPGRTLCYTDWRYPDGTSFVQGWGTLPRQEIQVGNPEDGMVKYISHSPFIAQEIPRPYGI